jgi:signal transduction histidine kinase
MKRWLADTLFKRLFALMWLALVVSHAVAFLVVTHERGMPRAGGLPTFPSLPPWPSSSGRPQAPPEPGLGPAGPRDPGARGPHGGDRPPPFPDRAGAPPPPDGPGAPPLPAPGLSAGLTLLDYGIRFVIIGLAAWLGARWLSRPVRRLSAASRALHQALVRNDRPPRVDEHDGTVEVREAARLFNEMSQQLTELVDARALLVAAISHDLRTPLTRIRMRLEGQAEDPQAARSIADIREMDELIESALEVFRGPGHEDPAQVTDVLALVQSLADDLADLGQPVSVAGAPALARVNPAALRRVVGNLVTNALRYGGRAELSVGTRGREVEILVDDHGPGIPPAQLEAVMQPFFRLESSRNRRTGGSGLGLYIARDLVTRQGGTLTLANRPEGGLRARIALPRV